MTDHGGDGARRETLRMQPVPIGLQVKTVGRPGEEITVITRAFAKGDIASCTRCDRCTANAAGSFCTIIAPGVVTPKDAASFGIRAAAPDLLGVRGTVVPYRLAGRGVEVVAADGATS